MSLSYGRSFHVCHCPPASLLSLAHHTPDFPPLVACKNGITACPAAETGLFLPTYLRFTTFYQYTEYSSDNACKDLHIRLSVVSDSRRSNASGDLDGQRRQHVKVSERQYSEKVPSTLSGSTRAPLWDTDNASKMGSRGSSVPAQ